MEKRSDSSSLMAGISEGLFPKQLFGSQMLLSSLASSHQASDRVMPGFISLSPYFTSKLDSEDTPMSLASCDETSFHLNIQKAPAHAHQLSSVLSSAPFSLDLLELDGRLEFECTLSLRWSIPHITSQTPIVYPFRLRWPVITPKPVYITYLSCPSHATVGEMFNVEVVINNSSEQQKDLVLHTEPFTFPEKTLEPVEEKIGDFLEEEEERDVCTENMRLHQGDATIPEPVICSQRTLNR
eukprot:TRINITY_DN12562_c0_g2_i1.p1 TRINITY_DN12562_c0_g2~~TRINITY_DN12562_c0_g2_i1.p1  ORF type:complete len:240 (+),score=56.76 TRINITY_DN12562_c0_g2_i1:474-1193(+)